MVTVQSLRIGVSRNSRVKDKDTWSHISLVSWVDEMRVRITHSAIGTDRNINVRLLDQHFGSCFLVSELCESWKRKSELYCCRWTCIIESSYHYQAPSPRCPSAGCCIHPIPSFKRKASDWLRVIWFKLHQLIRYDKGPMPLESVLGKCSLLFT